jgi:hypothetical protein
MQAHASTTEPYLILFHQISDHYEREDVADHANRASWYDDDLDDRMYVGQ